MALEEIMKDIKRGAERAQEHGALGWFVLNYPCFCVSGNMFHRIDDETRISYLPVPKKTFKKNEQEQTFCAGSHLALSQ